MPKLSLYTQKQSKMRDWRSELSRQGGSIQPIRAPRDVSSHNAAIHTNSVPKSANAPISGRISSQVPKSQPAKVTVPKINMPSVPRAQGAIHASAPKTGHDTGKISSAVPHAPPAKVSVPSVKMPTVPAVPNAKIQSVSYPISPALLTWRENPQALALIRARMVELANNHVNEQDPERRRILLSLIDRYARIQNDALHSPLSVSEAQRIIDRNGQDNWIDRQFSPALNTLVQSIGTGPGLASTFRNLGYVFGLPALIASDYGTGQGYKGKKSITDALAERAWYAYAPDWIRHAIIPAPLSTIPDQVKSLANFDAQQFETKMADVLNRITAETRDELGLGINQSGSEQSNVLRSRYLANSGLTKAQAMALVPYVALQRFADPLFNEYLPASVGPVGIDRQYLRNWYTEHVLGSFPPEVINAAAQIGLIGNPARIAPISVPSQGEPPELQPQPQQQQQQQLPSQQNQPQNQSQVFEPQKFEPQKQGDFVIRPSTVPSVPSQPSVPPEEQEEIDDGTNKIPIPENPQKNEQSEQSDVITDAKMANLQKLADNAADAETKARAKKAELLENRNKITKEIQTIKDTLKTWQDNKVTVDVNNPNWTDLLNQKDKSDIIAKAQDTIKQWSNEWPKLQANLKQTNEDIKNNRKTIKDTRELAFNALMRYRFAQLADNADTEPLANYKSLVNDYYDAYTDDKPEQIAEDRLEKLEKQTELKEDIQKTQAELNKIDSDYTTAMTQYNKTYDAYMAANYPDEDLPDAKQGEKLFVGKADNIQDYLHDLMFTPQLRMKWWLTQDNTASKVLYGSFYSKDANSVFHEPEDTPNLWRDLGKVQATADHSAAYNRANLIVNGSRKIGSNNHNYSDYVAKLKKSDFGNEGKKLIEIAEKFMHYENLKQKFEKEHKKPQPKNEEAVGLLETKLESLTTKLNDITEEIAAQTDARAKALEARENKINTAKQNLTQYESAYTTAAKLKPLPQIQGLLQSGLKIIGGDNNNKEQGGVMGNVVGLGSLVVGGGLLGLLNRASDSARDVPPAGYINLNYRDPAADPQSQPPVPLPAPNAPDSEFARGMERWIAREYAIRNPEPSIRQRISDMFRGSGEARPPEDESIPKINAGSVRLDGNNDNSQSLSHSNYAAIGSDDVDDRRVNLAKQALEQPHKSKVERNSKLVDASQKIDTGWGVKWIDDAIDYTVTKAKKVGTNTIKGINWTRDHINNLTDWVNDGIQDTINHWRGHNEDLSTVGMELPNVQDHVALGNSLRENLIIREEKEEEEEDEKEEEIDTHTPKKGRNRKKRN